MQSCRSKGHNLHSSFLWWEHEYKSKWYEAMCAKKSTSISTGHDHTSCCPTTLQKHVFPFNWSCSIVCQTCLYGSRSWQGVGQGGKGEGGSSGGTPLYLCTWRPLEGANTKSPSWVQNQDYRMLVGRMGETSFFLKRGHCSAFQINDFFTYLAPLVIYWSRPPSLMYVE